MQCRSVEERIQELLDERLDPASDPALIEHASACPRCGALLEAQSKLFEGLAFLATPSLPADFSSRVIRTVARQPRQTTLRRAQAAAFLAIVATLFLVVALGPQQPTKIGPADDPRAVASAAVDHRIDGTVMGISISDFDSQEVRLAIEHWMAQLAVAEHARFYRVDEIAGTIRPLASTLNVAFDAIRRSLPGRRQPPRSEPQAREVREPWAWHLI